MSGPPYDIRFKSPSNIFISGPSSSGKTFFLTKFLTYSESLLTKKLKFVLIYYQEWQDAYDKINKIFDNVKFIQGPPASLDHVIDELRQYNDKIMSILSCLSISKRFGISGEITFFEVLKNVLVAFMDMKAFAAVKSLLDRLAPKNDVTALQKGQGVRVRVFVLW